MLGKLLDNPVVIMRDVTVGGLTIWLYNVTMRVTKFLLAIFQQLARGIIMECRLPICLLLFGLLSFNAHGEVKRWVDDNGRVHYSDQPPPANTKVTPLITTATPATAASGVSAPKSLAERDAEYKKAQKAKEVATQKTAQQQEQALAKQKFCADTRTNLTILENSPRIMTYDANGERSFLDDAARQQRIEEARKSIGTNCN